MMKAERMNTLGFIGLETTQITVTMVLAGKLTTIAGHETVEAVVHNGLVRILQVTHGLRMPHFQPNGIYFIGTGKMTMAVDVPTILTTGGTTMMMITEATMTIWTPVQVALELVIITGGEALIIGTDIIRMFIGLLQDQIT
jgi:hypothetical protein